LYKEEEKELLRVLGDVIIDVQHIGSTSVPGMIAKPIIDIMVAVKNLGDLALCIGGLEKLHYRFLGTGGRPGRLFFVKGQPENVTHHLHLVEKDSHYWRDNIFFRDYLRTHDNIAKEYAKLKLELAAKFKTDRESYKICKSKFIKRCQARQFEYSENKNSNYVPF